MSTLEITQTTYQKDDVLIRSGKRAVVIEPAIHRVSKKFIGYLVWLHTDGKPMPQKCTLFCGDLRDNWTLKPAAEAVETVPVELDDGVTLDVPVEPLNEELTATAELIAQLRRENAELEAENEALKESRDSAIDELSALDNRTAERNETNREQIELAHKRFDQLHEEGAKKFGAQWLLANQRVNSLVDHEYVPEDEFGNTDIRIKTLLSETAMIIATKQQSINILTEQLAEARAAHAPVLNTAASDTLTAPKQEVCVMRDVAQHHIADKLNDGWQILHLQFMNSASGDAPDRLNVVLTRIVTVPTPQSRKVAAVGPMVSYIPVERVTATERADHDLAEVLAYGKEIYENALAASPISIRPLSLIPGGQP